MFSMTLNSKDFNAEMRNFGLDLRKSARRIVKEVADEIVEESVNRVKVHRKTGNMELEIYEYPMSAWTRIVVFGKSVWLDEGSKPHRLPTRVAKEMAKYYNTSPHNFWEHVRKHGTKPHPFIDESFYTVVNRIDDIMRRELERTLKR